MSARHANFDRLLEDLREELSIAPSAHFEHRVRQRLLDPSCEHGRRLLPGVDRSGVGLICAAAVVAAMSVITASSWVRNASTVVPSIAAALHADAGARPITVPSVLSSNSVAPVQPANESIRATSSSVAAVPPIEFEVLVPPDQAIALRRLLAAMAAGRSVVPAGTTMTVAETGELQEPEPIGITELPKIAPLDVREGARGRERR